MVPRTALPPVFGTMFIVGPPTSASPRPPDVVKVTSCALAMSGRYPDTPPPLSGAPTPRPSTWRRPSVPRPPGPPNTTSPGLVSTSRDPPVTAGTSWKSAPYERDVGRDAITSPSTVVWRLTLCTSTIGDSPVTVIVSSSEPTRRSALTVLVNVPVSSIPSRLTVLSPVNVNVTEYTPGRRSTMRYWPEPSVTALRTFSMSAGLAASTTTPGSTAPELSFTMPVIDALSLIHI